jgi:hypothetical protein
MVAVAERDQGEREFVGHVFSRPSPILTWRPVKVQRIASTALSSDTAGCADSPSLAPTKRLLAWPVVRRVGRGSGRGPVRAIRALLTLVTLSLMCGSALAIGVYLAFGDGPAWHSNASTASADVAPLRTDLPSRVATAHVGDHRLDTLAPAPVPVVTAVAPRPTAPAAPASHRVRTTRHPHHDGGSTLHAFHSPARGTRSPHRAT